MTHNILIIDDEPDIRQLLSITVSRMGLSSYCADTLQQGFQALKERNFQVCLTDLRLPDGSGLDIVKHIQQQYSELPVIVITAHGSMDIAINAMKYGAFDFINKPVDLHHLRSLIHNALSSHVNAKSTSDFPEIVGESKPIHRLKQNIIKVSRSQAPVFIVGESGSGKELVARSIHTHSSRQDQPFIAVNCGAIPTELMESELFGHTKGSFTGAHQDKQGLFLAANGGTLLLDEIADLPLDMQVKLLRVLQEKRVRPIGSQTEISIDVRVLSSTHKNLSDAVGNGRFRSDLFYRINVIEITVPPLRERIDDVDILSNTILEKIATQNNHQKQHISPEAIQVLKQHTYPGNVRELENILERACALTEKHLITPESLLFSNQVPSHTDTSDQKPASVEQQNNTTIKGQIKESGYDSNLQTIDEYIKEVEKDILLAVLQQNRWNRTLTAKELGITFRSLRYRLKKLGIDVDNDK
ncbi:sigma-54-dependent Fis family transcriptional regulator [Candidatus Endobugula sertula]|uniref:Sigma-54-dependent Fis family transcriptional regulator n=1 Tax=Candidatus Endobugula sertula TaxID=62101 RepID=A0A1D2QTS2_9GAMM|nr:sigma-54-dependent Fis family transcriptional regulator [Candidatus Endobugula sertula]